MVHYFIKFSPSILERKRGPTTSFLTIYFLVERWGGIWVISNEVSKTMSLFVSHLKFFCSGKRHNLRVFPQKACLISATAHVRKLGTYSFLSFFFSLKYPPHPPPTPFIIIIIIMVIFLIFGSVASCDVVTLKFILPNKLKKKKNVGTGYVGGNWTYYHKKSGGRKKQKKVSFIETILINVYSIQWMKRKKR